MKVEEKEMEYEDDPPGICGEPTTYRCDFRNFGVRKAERGQGKRVLRKAAKVASGKRKEVFAESHDTYQKFDYKSRLKFDALWRPKDIVGTDPRKTVVSERPPQVEKTQPLRAKLNELISPAVNFNDAKDPEARNILVDYTYKSTMGRAAGEVRQNFEARDGLQDDWVSLKSKIPGEIESSDDGKCYFSHQSLIESCEKLLEKERLRRPYVKLPLSYGGHRTPIALGVGLEKKILPWYHPDLTVSQTLAS